MSISDKILVSDKTSDSVSTVNFGVTGALNPFLVRAKRIKHISIIEESKNKYLICLLILMSFHDYRYIVTVIEYAVTVY